jgi:hypothetical protein
VTIARRWPAFFVPLTLVVALFAVSTQLPAPFEQAKILALALIGVASALFLPWKHHAANSQVDQQRVWRWLLAFLLVRSVGCVFALEPNRAWFGSSLRLQGVALEWLLLGLACQLTPTFFCHWRSLCRILAGLAIGLLLVATAQKWGWLHLLGPTISGRPGATLGNPNTLAGCVLLMAPLIWSGYRQETATRWRVFASAGLLAALLLLWLCASRAAWLALLVAAFYTAAQSKFGGRWRWPCLIAVVISLGLMSAITLSDTSRWSSVSQRQNLLDQSLAIWSASPTLIDTFGQPDYAASVRKLIGYGADQQALLYADQSVSYLGARPDRAHQYFVDLLLESGPLAVICMLGLVVAIWRLPRRDAMDGVLKWALAVHFISMQVGFALTAEKFLCALWLMLLLGAPNQTTEETDTAVALPKPNWSIRFGLLALAATMLLMLWPASRIGHTTLRALHDFQNGQRAVLRYQQKRQRVDLAAAAIYFSQAQKGERFEPVYGLAAREFAPYRDR